MNNAYAQYKNDEYGEKVTLYNHEDNVAVELGVTKDDKKYAVAINYDLNTDFEARKEGEAPAKAFINKKEELAQFVSNSEIRDMVSDFKEFSTQKEQTQSKAKAAPEMSH